MCMSVFNASLIHFILTIVILSPNPSLQLPSPPDQLLLFPFKKKKEGKKRKKERRKEEKEIKERRKEKNSPPRIFIKQDTIRLGSNLHIKAGHRNLV